MNGIVAINGQFFKPDQAVISPMDRGFLYGDSIFETFVAYGSHILHAAQHLDRLKFSAEQMDFQLPIKDEQILFEMQHALDLLQSPKASIRLVFTRGEGLGLSPSTAQQPNRLIYCMPVSLEESTYLAKGMRLYKSRLGYTLRGPMPKISGYQHSIAALAKAQRLGFDDIIWENSHGEITESSIANIFFISRQGDQIHISTPSLESGILPGITRENLLQLLRSSGIGADEDIIDASELAKFDEAFLCSTVRGLIPVRAIGDHQFYTLRRESTFNVIRQMYKLYEKSFLK